MTNDNHKLSTVSTVRASSWASANDLCAVWQACSIGYNYMIVYWIIALLVKCLIEYLPAPVIFSLSNCLLWVIPSLSNCLFWIFSLSHFPFSVFYRTVSCCKSCYSKFTENYLLNYIFPLYHLETRSESLPCIFSKLWRDYITTFCCYVVFQCRGTLEPNSVPKVK